MNNPTKDTPSEVDFFPEWRSQWIGTCLRVVFIFALVFLIYSPELPGSFVMDDHRLVKDENALVTGQMSPLTFWFQTDFTLSALAWWLQWLAWGDYPLGYHVVNIALHGLSAVLLWRVLKRLKIPSGWFAAVVFAAHPVCVNSVARIAELKNTLSLPFFLLSLWAYLRYEAALNPAAAAPLTSRQDAWRRGGWYALALVAFVLALLSKTSTVMLPVVLLACALWQRRRLTVQDGLQTAGFWLLAAVFGLMSIWFQAHQALADAGQTLAPESWGQRVAIAGHVIWFYLGKALLPIHLSLVYPRWNMDVNTFAAYLPILALVGGLAVAGWFWRTWGRAVLLGAGCFIACLFPVLGLFDSQFLVKWQVSDHLQYLPLIAPVVVAVGGLAALIHRRIFIGGMTVMIVILSVLSYQRAEAFSTQEKLMRDTVAKNPAASDAHNDLGVVLAQRQDYPGAQAEFAAAVTADPVNASAHLNLGRAFMMGRDYSDAEEHLRTACELNPADPVAHTQLGGMLMQEGKIHDALIQFMLAQSLSRKPDSNIAMNLATVFYQTGDYQRAANQYRKVLAAHPDNAEALNNLAWLLATCPDVSVRDGAKAVEYAMQACQLTDYQKTPMLSTLGAAYAEAGRFPEAIAITQRALQMQTANGETRFMAVSGQLLKMYQAGMPYHQAAAGQQGR